MRGSPRNAAPEHRPISTTPKVRPEAQQPERVSTSRYAKPKVLMGEVAAPIPKFAASGGGGQQIGQQRDAFRAFMIARHLRPSDWARAAGVAPGEIMAFLTGHARAIPPASLEKLARAANCAVEDLFI
ncbi:MAG TPA: helix-turn-helix transcriptional regulator [Rhizomicrobium sp.]|nr:helix-turn-helix transcriptional regulator [Rhizomicrobium sp.]